MTPTWGQVTHSFFFLLFFKRGGGLWQSSARININTSQAFNSVPLVQCDSFGKRILHKFIINQLRVLNHETLVESLLEKAKTHTSDGISQGTTHYFLTLDKRVHYEETFKHIIIHRQQYEITSTSYVGAQFNHKYK